MLSAYIEPGLTEYSHDLGSSKGLVVIAARVSFFQPMLASNKFKQYMSLVSSTGHAKAAIHQLSRSMVFEFRATNLWDVTLETEIPVTRPIRISHRGRDEALSE